MIERATTTPAPEDPIVAEVRVSRKALLAKAGGTLAGLCDWLKKREQAHPARLVNLPPRPAEEPAQA